MGGGQVRHIPLSYHISSNIVGHPYHLICGVEDFRKFVWFALAEVERELEFERFEGVDDDTFSFTATQGTFCHHQHVSTLLYLASFQPMLQSAPWFSWYLWIHAPK